MDPQEMSTDFVDVKNGSLFVSDPCVSEYIQG